jgi:hypothetical protein
MRVTGGPSIRRLNARRAAPVVKTTWNPAGLRARRECPEEGIEESDRCFEEVRGRIDDLELEVERKRALKYDGITSGVNHDAGERQKCWALLL